MNVGDKVIYRHGSNDLPRFGVGRIKEFKSARSFSDGPFTSVTLEVLVDEHNVYHEEDSVWGITQVDQATCIPYNAMIWADLAWDSGSAQRLATNIKARWDDAKWRYRNA